MPKKIYCVKKGRKTGKFDTWAQCKEQVEGFAGAVYKSFTNHEDADRFLSSKEKPRDNGEVAIAYVDGSFKESTNEFACGVVLFYKDEVVKISKKYDDPRFTELNNVAGEIMGAVETIRYCIKNEIKNVDIYYDYEGVGSWGTGDWDANKVGTKAYKKFCDNNRDKLNFRFVKVKAHSNNEYNDMADELAKKALGIVWRSENGRKSVNRARNCLWNG